MTEKEIKLQIAGDYYIHMDFEPISDSLTNRDLFHMALRVNKKRSFLFVSHLLGKHLPVEPVKALLTGHVLAGLYTDSKGDLELLTRQGLRQLGEAFQTDEATELLKRKRSLDRKTLILGFAETATALGHSVFSAFSQNAYYLHTTREKIRTDVDPVVFYEEHSHATEHRIYAPGKNPLKSQCDILLVDDEISTGKTILNIIRAIHKSYPRPKYDVLTILDWRNEESVAAFKDLEVELGITIGVHGIAKGEFELCNEMTYDQLEGVEHRANFASVNGQRPMVEFQVIQLGALKSQVVTYSHEAKDQIVSYLKWTGRFGLDSSEQTHLEELASQMGATLKAYRKGVRTLCLGTGEFMYIPMLLASFMGDDVHYHSTTRSPILPLKRDAYGARIAYLFQDPFNTEITNYFYNVHEGQYDDLFIFIEKPLEAAQMETLNQALSATGIPNIHIVSMTS